jgi:hypothetical protein
LDAQEGPYHSKEEADEAIRGLPVKYWVALRRRSMWKLKDNCVSDVDDIISDLWERFAVSGTRKWRVGISMEMCFRSAVRSEINGRWDQHKRLAAKQHAPIAPDGQEVDRFEGIPAPTPDPLTELEEGPERKRQQAIIDHIQNYFAADEHVTAILIGRDWQMSPQDVQKEFGLTETQYDSATRKLRRFLNKQYPRGWRTDERQQESQDLA